MELLNEAVRWPCEDEGKGLSESERRTRIFRTSLQPTTFCFLSTGEYLQLVWDLSEALSSKLCGRGQLVSLEVMYAATVAETGQDRIWKEVRSVSSG